MTTNPVSPSDSMDVNAKMSQIDMRLANYNSQLFNIDLDLGEAAAVNPAADVDNAKESQRKDLKTRIKFLEDTRKQLNSVTQPSLTPAVPGSAPQRS